MAGIATAVIGLIITATTVFRGVLEELGKLAVRKIRRRDQSFRNGLESLAKFHAVLEAIRNLEFVDRVLVFEGRNGGGIPKAGCVFTARSVFGWSNKDTHPERIYDDAFNVDSHYITMLREVIDKGSLTVLSANLPKGSQLRAFYSREGVVCSQIYFLQLDETNNSMSYVSIASYTAEFNEDQLSEIGLLISRIRGLIN